MRNVGIYRFTEVEALDFAGPFEVFSTASRVFQHLQPNAAPPFEVFTVGEYRTNIRARGGLVVARHFHLAHWEDVADLRGFLPDTQVIADTRWVDEGALVRALDMSLHMVARFVGKELAVRTVRQMDYEWREATDQEEEAGGGVE